MRNSMMLPPGVMRPIRLIRSSVNQRLPSGPAVIAEEPLPVVGVENSLIVAVGLGLVPVGGVPHPITRRLPAIATTRGIKRFFLALLKVFNPWKGDVKGL